MAPASSASSWVKEESYNPFMFQTQFVFFSFLQPHLWHMEVPRLGVEWELQLPTHATATAKAGSELHLRPTLRLAARLVL